MQFNIIFKTIFEYIHDKFCFVHICTNTFCKYRKKLLASPRVHLVNNHDENCYPVNKFDKFATISGNFEEIKYFRHATS